MQSATTKIKWNDRKLRCIQKSDSLLWVPLKTRPSTPTRCSHQSQELRQISEKPRRDSKIPRKPREKPPQPKQATQNPTQMASKQAKIGPTRRLLRRCLKGNPSRLTMSLTPKPQMALKGIKPQYLNRLLASFAISPSRSNVDLNRCSNQRRRKASNSRHDGDFERLEGPITSVGDSKVKPTFVVGAQ